MAAILLLLCSREEVELTLTALPEFIPGVIDTLLEVVPPFNAPTPCN